jgi:integrase
MARTVRNAKLDSRSARERLNARGKPYWHTLDQGLHVGYRRLRGAPGRWVVRFYNSDKRKYVTETVATADDFSDANGVDVLRWPQVQVEARKRRDRRAQTETSAGPYTIAQALADHEMSEDSRSRSNTMILPALGEITLDDPKLTEKITAWHRGLAALPPRLRTPKGKAQRYRGSSNDPDKMRARQNTGNRLLAIAKGALTNAWRNGKVASDVAWRRVKPFKDVTGARIHWLTIEEARRLINASDPDFRNLARVAIETGCRYSELARLEVRDFNPDVGTVAIMRSKPGKTRHVVLTEEGRVFFASLCARRAGDELVLRRSDGSAWGSSNQTVPIALACARGNITPPANFHALRHTWASLAVMNGTPLHVVSKNLGHSDTRMVEKHYGIWRRPIWSTRSEKARRGLGSSKRIGR